MNPQPQRADTLGMANPRNTEIPRVFVIGLSRTGTSSLNEALQLLGSAHTHNPDPEPFFEGDFSLFESYNSGSDISVAAFYRELDEAYPGSKFVLTLRDAEAWLRSVVIHFTTLPKNSTMGRRGELRERVYGSAWPTPEQFLESYKRHITEVAAYFRGREEDLLVMDVTKGDGWEKLCPFIGRQIPNVPFPFTNTTTEETAERAKQNLASGKKHGSGIWLPLPLRT